MYKVILWLSVFAFSLSSIMLCAQEVKVEHEKKVKKEDFPQKSLERLSPILDKSKSNKFYREFDGENYFYELKTKYKKGDYSIKFTEDGELVDIERLYDFEKVKKNLREQMRQHLTENYKKHRIERFQIQYNREIEDDEPEDDEDYMEDFLEMDLEDLIVNYEMEVEVLSEDGESTLLELLFNSKGELLKERKVKRRDEDYILY